MEKIASRTTNNMNSRTDNKNDITDNKNNIKK